MVNKGEVQSEVTYPGRDTKDGGRQTPPVTRLKRRILLRRARVEPKTIKQDVSEEVPTFQTSSLISDRHSDYKRGDKNKETKFEKNIDLGRSSDMPSLQRSKTPQPTNRIKSYLERWKEAKLESRPCTVVGLMELERQGRESWLNTELPTVRNRNVDRVANKSPAKSEHRDVQPLLDPIKRIHALPFMRRAQNRKQHPSHIEDGTHSHDINSTANNVSLENRPFTSLGTLTASLKNNNDEEKDAQIVNTRRSVAFVSRPTTPWVIARRSERSLTDEPSVLDRPPTPGVRLAKPRTVQNYKSNDMVVEDLTVNDKIPSELAGVNKLFKDFTAVDKDCDGIITAEKGFNNGIRGDRLTAETIRPGRHMEGGDKGNNSRRIIIARNRNNNRQSDTIAVAGNNPEKPSRLEHRRIPPQASGTQNSDYVQGTLASETYRNSPKWLGDRSSLGGQPAQSSVFENPTKILGNQNVNRGDRQLNNTTSKIVSNGHLTVAQLKERYLTRLKLDNRIDNAPNRSQSTPLTKHLLDPEYQESGKNNLQEKETRVLSWLGECEESSLPNHLPIISFNDKD